MSDLPDAPAPEILRTPEGASLAYHRRYTAVSVSWNWAQPRHGTQSEL